MRSADAERERVLNFLSILLRDPRHEASGSKGDTESQIIERELETLEALKSKLDQTLSCLPKERIEALNIARQGSSNTLSRDQSARASWDQTNRLIETWIHAGEPLSWQKVLEINHSLTQGTDASGVRTQDIYTGIHKHLEATWLPEAIAAFECEVLALEQKTNPILYASLLRYWIASVHPFQDANGRTATLVADWTLLKNGYPPLCFPRVIDGTVAYVPEAKEWATSRFAFMKTSEALKRSFELLLVRE